MGCSHHHPTPANYDRAFAIGIALNMAFVLVEAGAGWWTNSLALLSDAGHNLSDVLALAIAWGAVWLARYPATDSHSYGYRRGSILAALINAWLILAAAAIIAYEAIQRFMNPVEVGANTVMIVAAIGIVINLGTALLFMRGRKDDLNIQGAWLHMMGDTAVSVGVVLAGFGIKMTGATWIDPAVSLLVAGVLVLSTKDLLKDSLNLAMDAVPKHIDHAKVRAYFETMPGIASIHNLHIWALSTTDVALTVHLVAKDATPDLHKIREDMRHQFGIQHVTVQVESAGMICGDHTHNHQHDHDHHHHGHHHAS